MCHRIFCVFLSNHCFVLNTLQGAILFSKLVQLSTTQTTGMQQMTRCVGVLFCVASCRLNSNICPNFLLNCYVMFCSPYSAFQTRTVQCTRPRQFVAVCCVGCFVLSVRSVPKTALCASPYLCTTTHATFLHEDRCGKYP